MTDHSNDLTIHGYPPPRRPFVELVDDVRTEVARLNTELRDARAQRDQARANAAELERLLWLVVNREPDARDQIIKHLADTPRATAEWMRDS